MISSTPWHSYFTLDVLNLNNSNNDSIFIYLYQSINHWGHMLKGASPRQLFVTSSSNHPVQVSIQVPFPHIYIYTPLTQPLGSQRKREVLLPPNTTRQVSHANRGKLYRLGRRKGVYGTVTSYIRRFCIYISFILCFSVIS